MGMYTELIFGASLKKETPKEVIDTLRHMIGDIELKPEELAFSSPRSGVLFRCSSYYFGVNENVGRIWQDQVDSCWHISTRSNIKNYDSDIEEFLKWIKPWIKSGSGRNEMYAVVTYEEGVPEIYSLYDIPEQEY